MRAEPGGTEGPLLRGTKALSGACWDLGAHGSRSTASAHLVSRLLASGAPHLHLFLQREQREHLPSAFRLLCCSSAVNFPLVVVIFYYIGFLFFFFFSLLAIGLPVSGDSIMTQKEESIFFFHRWIVAEGGKRKCSFPSVLHSGVMESCELPRLPCSSNRRAECLGRGLC